MGHFDHRGARPGAWLTAPVAMTARRIGRLFHPRPITTV